MKMKTLRQLCLLFWVVLSSVLTSSSSNKEFDFALSAANDAFGMNNATFDNDEINPRTNTTIRVNKSFRRKIQEEEDVSPGSLSPASASNPTANPSSFPSQYPSLVPSLAKVPTAVPTRKPVVLKSHGPVVTKYVYLILYGITVLPDPTEWAAVTSEYLTTFFAEAGFRIYEPNVEVTFVKELGTGGDLEVLYYMTTDYKSESDELEEDELVAGPFYIDANREKYVNMLKDSDSGYSGLDDTSIPESLGDLDLEAAAGSADEGGGSYSVYYIAGGAGALVLVCCLCCCCCICAFMMYRSMNKNDDEEMDDDGEEDEDYDDDFDQY